MADTDLEQYNGTPSFPATADVGTNADPFLEPTDGPVVCGNNNGVNQAPVNKALRRAKDLSLGQRGGIFGDFVGAVQKTVRSLYANATGGTTHTKAAGTLTAAGGGMAGTPSIEAETGDIRATNHNIHAVNGDIIADLGIINAVNGQVVAGDTGTPAYSALTRAALSFLGTAVSGANPAQGVSIKNQLRAKNTVKHWGRVSGTAGAVTFQDGAGAWSAAIFDAGGGKVARYRIRVTMTDAMADANYAVSVTTHAPDNAEVAFPIVLTDTITSTVFDVTLYVPITGFQGYQPLNSVAFDIGFVVMGKQTT